MADDDTPVALPPHPEEKRLRVAESELALALRLLDRKVRAALRVHDRPAALVLLTQLEATVDAARQAMARAIDDQMGVLRGDTYPTEEDTP